MISYLKDEMKDHLNLKLIGDFDIDGTEVIEDELIPMMEKYKTVDLDFELVPFVDSSGMGLLMNVVQTLNGLGIKVAITNIREDVMEIFDLLQIPEILGKDVFK